MTYSPRGYVNSYMPSAKRRRGRTRGCHDGSIRSPLYSITQLQVSLPHRCYLCSLPSLLPDRCELATSARARPGSSKSFSSRCQICTSTQPTITIPQCIRPGVDPSSQTKLCRRAPSPLSMRLLLPNPPPRQLTDS